MNKFFTITFRISDVYTGTFRYKMYIHVYSHIIAREINVAICMYMYTNIYILAHLTDFNLAFIF